MSDNNPPDNPPQGNKKARRRAKREAFLEKLYIEGKLRQPKELKNQHIPSYERKRGGGSNTSTYGAKGLSGVAVVENKHVVIDRNEEGEVVGISKLHHKPTTFMSDMQKSEFIERIKIGIPISVILREFNFGARVLHNTYKQDPAFMDLVKTYEDALVGDCETVIYQKAISQEPGSVQAAGMFIGIRAANQARSESMKLKRAELRMKKAALNMLDKSKDDEVQPDFELLPAEDFATFTSIYDRMNSGEPITDQEKVTVFNLMLKAKGLAVEKRKKQLALEFVNDDLRSASED